MKPRPFVMGHRRTDHRMTGEPEPVYVGFSDPEIIRRLERQNRMDLRLLPTHRHMQQWAESQGADLPVDPDAGDGIPRTKLPPLNDDYAVITDQIVQTVPEDWRNFIFSLYRSPKPTEVIAEEFGWKKTQVYFERKLVLAYLLGRLTEAGVRLASYRLK